MKRFNVSAGDFSMFLSSKLWRKGTEESRIWVSTISF